MASTGKDTIYIDIDDEITSIIDKLQGSTSKIVALVLPKRAAALQSIVNMKLLKRAADEANKNLVLITSEAGLLPLAGATGLYVAKNLQSKPEIPAAPDIPEPDEEETAEVEPAGDEPLDASKSVGELSGKEDDSVEIDNDEPDDKAKPKKKSKGKKDKNPKIPNFEKFRLKLFLIIGGVLALIGFWILAVFVLPKATIAVKTDTSTVNAKVEFTASPTKLDFDESAKIVPSKLAEQNVEESQTAPATGEKDVGTKATGQVTVKNCSSGSVTIPAGTAVSSGGLNFLTNSSLSLDSGNFTPPPGSTCKDTGSHVGTVNVTAQANGDQYNLASGASYSVAGQGSSVTGTGSAMTGGTSKTAKVVSQQDVDTAKAKMTTTDDQVKSNLQKELDSGGYYAIAETFAKKDETTTASPEVGQEATEVKVTYKSSDSMVGVNQDDLNKLIEASISGDIDTSKQSIQDYGVSKATFKVVSTKPNGDMVIDMDTQVTVGPDINEDQLKQEIAGKKRGETENIIKAIPGVQDAQVSYSPFWVSRTPKKASKISFTYEKAN